MPSSSQKKLGPKAGSAYPCPGSRRGIRLHLDKDIQACSIAVTGLYPLRPDSTATTEQRSVASTAGVVT